MAQFKVGDKVRLVKAREDGKIYDEPDFYNSWEPEMTRRVNNRDEGIITGIAGTGIRIAGWEHGYPPDSFELVTEIDWDKPLQTRDGDPVTIITRVGRGKYCVIGYIGDEDDTTHWLPDGRFFDDEQDTDGRDIINAPEKPMQKEVWFNVFKENGTLRTGHRFDTRQEADDSPSNTGRVGCIKVVLTEGQFDN